ncbi:metallophosphoesterase [Methylophaga pinxianii]|uniref:metallophosphoesterase n=1 Tax=Methylophaga pinxianii TaxID=2881052 RepID=UPI001CF1BC71|nr:metallophosphoesterase [Methylophaga pinxianii]MCB2425401.1 metallophosphoesterase [Methylophaga pinxianii]UPH46172.1 metallophosphoesterase [Methylophaga pinxianii]
MKFQLFSDLHLEQGYPFHPNSSDADLIILAGDIDVGLRGLEYAAELIDRMNTPVIYIPGNHEFYRHDINDLRNEMHHFAESKQKLHLLDNSSVIMKGIRFIGSTLWTDYVLDGRFNKAETMSLINFMLNDHRLINKGKDRFTTEDALELHLESKAFLINQLNEPFDGKTVVVTHHAPSLKAHHPHFEMDTIAAAFISDCDELLKLANVWCFGHTHANVDTVIDGCRLVSNQKGYSREMLPQPFNLDLIIEV